MAKKKQNKQQGQQFLSDENYLRQRARSLKIGKCYITDTSDGVMDDVIVTRQHTGGRISMACYVVDNYCLGVKDSFYRLRIEEYELQDHIRNEWNSVTFRECSYEEAHNRIYGAIAFAEETGIAPHKSFALTKYMLEEDTDDIPLIEYEYGKDGKHLLICETQLEASKYLPLLEKNLGKGNYDYIIGMGGESNDLGDEDNFSYHVDMQEILEGYDREAVVDMAADFGLTIDDGLSEEEARKAYADFIKGNPKTVLTCLSNHDIYLLEEVDEKGSDYLEADLEDNDLLPMIIKYGFAEEYYGRYDNRMIRVADDFFAAMKPHFEEAKENDARVISNIAENIVEGLANLYGLVRVDEARQYLIRQIGYESDRGNQVFDGIRDISLLLKSMERPLNPEADKKGRLPEDQLCYVSRFCRMSVAKLQEQIARYDETVTSPKVFSNDQVMEAGSVYPVIPNDGQRTFEDFLNKKLGLNHYNAWFFGTQLWLRVQHEHIHVSDLESPEEYFEYEVLKFARKSVSQKTRREAMQLLREYLDHIPRWVLKGHSSHAHSESASL